MVLYIFIIIEKQRWLLFSPWHLKWIKSNFLLVTPAVPLAHSKCFVGTHTEEKKNKREKRKNKIGKKWVTRPSRVFAIVSLEATLALFFNCRRCYRSGRPIPYILYSPWRWRRGDPTAACFYIVNRITRGSDSVSHFGVREFRKFQKLLR